MKIVPLNDNIVVQREAAEDKTAAGIVLPESAKQKPMRGRVLAVGPGRWSQTGERRVPMTVKEGDNVLFERYAANAEHELDGQKVLIMSEASVISVIG